MYAFTEIQLPVPRTCGTGWETFGQTCYKLVTTQKSFDDANVYCQSLQSSKLIAMETSAETDFIQSMIANRTSSGKLGNMIVRIHKTLFIMSPPHRICSFE